MPPQLLHLLIQIDNAVGCIYSVYEDYSNFTVVFDQVIKLAIGTVLLPFLHLPSLYPVQDVSLFTAIGSQLFNQLLK